MFRCIAVEGYYLPTIFSMATEMPETTFGSKSSNHEEITRWDTFYQMILGKFVF